MRAPPSRQLPRPFWPEFPCVHGGIVLTALALVGCSSAPARRDPPVPTLASSAEAARAFGDLRKRWTSASREERKAMRADIEGLRSQFAGEQVARQADLYLAWIALEFGEFDEARRLAELAGSPHPGNVRMLGQLVEGASLSRSGESDEALRLLLPLVGQLIDLYARDLLHEEAVISAVTAQRWQDALWLLDVWLRDVPEDDQQAVLDIVRALVKGIPSEPLETTLRQRATLDTAARGGALDKVLVRQLAVTALELKDSALARRLLEHPGALPMLGDSAAALLDLAARFDVPQVAGRQVGVYVADGGPELAQRAAQITLGALDVLGSPGGGARVVVRQSPTEDAAAALAALDTEGVSVLIGGTDPASAEKLARFSESEGLAALLLVPPSSATPHRWAFVFGPDEQQPAAALAESLARQGAQQIAVIGASALLPASPRLLPSIPCVALPPAAQLTRYPLREWRSRGVDGLLLLGSARCAQDAIDEARAAGISLRIALGPVAAEALQPLPPGASRTRRAPPPATFAALGCYPTSQPNAAISAGGLPGYFRKLSQDAARTAALALAGLPDDRTLDASEVKQRRERVRAALEDAAPSLCLGLRPRRDQSPPPWHLTERRLGQIPLERFSAPLVKKRVRDRRSVRLVAWRASTVEGLATLNRKEKRTTSCVPEYLA